MSETIIGIDLGTTNSEVAVLVDGRPVVIGDSATRVVPSVVGIADNGGILVGEPARNQYVLYPERTVKSVKRLMGGDQPIQLGERSFSPQEVSAIILRHLKGMAEEFLGQPVAKAVITVPAYFNDAQRKATREAGEIAGLEVVRIVNEPTAAALTYEGASSEPKKILVYDLGGGTFDVSVVRREVDVVEVVASHGNNHLGGDDFDQRIIDHLVKLLQEQQQVDARSSRQAMARLTRAAEAAKRALSDTPYARIEEEYLLEKDGQPIHLRAELSRDDYEAMIADYVEETLQAVHIAIKGAQMTVADIDEVLLVGGATRTPLVRRRLEEEFRAQPRGEIDPDLCVAMGAAVQAGMIAGQSVATVLVDITPYTFGTRAIGEVDGEFTDDMYVPIVRKNTPIPVTKSEVFYTHYDGQNSVEVKVYQGEEPYASDNVEIGSFMVTGLGQVPAGNPIVFRAALDLNGVLHVTALEKQTGLEKSIVIDNAIARFEQEELAAARERVGALFGDSAPTGGGNEAAQRLVERARQALDSASADDREDLVGLIERVEDALARDDAQALTAASDELSDILHYLEG